MSYAERKEIYKKIEGLRKRPLLVYVTSTRSGNGGQMGLDVIPEFCEQIDRISKRKNEVDILLVSQGGDPIVPWRIMGLLRERFKEIGVIIPYAAQSAATILSFGADEIIMHPFACLGPIDPQITDFSNPLRPRVFSAEDLKCFAEFMSSDMKVSDVDFGKNSIELLGRVLDPLSIGTAKKSMKLSENLASKLLSLHMTDTKKIAAIVKEYNNKAHHGYTISRSEARDAGLPVKNSDPKMESLMWKIWIDIESELKCRVPFHPPGLLIGKTNAYGAPVQAIKEDTDIAVLESKGLKCTCRVQTVVSLMAPMINTPHLNMTVDVIPLGWDRQHE